MAGEARVVIAIRQDKIWRMTLCRSMGQAKSIATGLRRYGCEVRILKAEDVLTLAAIAEPDSDSRLSKSKDKFTKKSKDFRLKQQLQAMRSPSRMAQ